MPGHLYLQHLSAGLHLAGAHGATAFPDVKGHTFYRTGAVAISTAQSRFAGEGSAYFPGGVNDLIKCDAHADFGSSGSSLAISFSMRPLAYPVGQDVRLIMIGTNGSTASFFVAIAPGGGVYFGIAASGTSYTSSAVAVALNTWSDVLFTLIGGRGVLCVNRAIVGLNESQTVPSSGGTRRVQIGGDNSGFSSVDGRFYGYLSEVEIQLAGARMPPVVAPTAPFLDYLGIGVAAAVPAPVPVIRSPVPAHRILRQGTPGLLLDTEHGGRGQIVGTTHNVGTPNYPVSRRVRLFRKRDGVLAREVWSDTAGNYAFNKIRHDIKYVVNGHDHTGLYNAEVSDSLEPEVV
jgi:hypothetical protein